MWSYLHGADFGSALERSLAYKPKRWFRTGPVPLSHPCILSPTIRLSLLPVRFEQTPRESCDYCIDQSAPVLVSSSSISYKDKTNLGSRERTPWRQLFCRVGSIQITSQSLSIAR